MKKLITVLFVLALLSLNANAQKVAYIHRDSVLSSIPEMQNAQKELNSYLSQVQNELKNMQQDYQTKVQTFNASVDTLSEIVKKNKMSEIQDLETRIQEFQVDAQTDYLKKQKKLVAPIMNKFNKALKKIRKSGGYDVVKVIGDDILYVNPKFIITDEVMEELGTN